MKKQDFQNYVAELQITIGNKITEAINKLNKAITVKLENNKDEIRVYGKRLHHYRTNLVSLKVKSAY